ncbi:MAG: bifunctional adenosylcobinamide kinase/adenosylcobinamide-phosphate guanylyltransferase [Thermodesulfobacteriota bacterium]
MSMDTPMDTPLSLLVLGGCRSGKSRFAEEWVAARYPRRTFLATMARSDDQEMARRIALHRQRRTAGWRTVEEPLDLVGALRREEGQGDVVLIDCLTLWLTNLLLHELTDSEIEGAVADLAQGVAAAKLPVVLVANEVGLGLVPESPLGRRFRDLAGWTNQQMAAVCSHVVLVSAGLPLALKGTLP